MSQRILIIGATSAIAQSVAKIYATQQHPLYLVARNQAHLTTITEDLAIRGAGKIGQFILGVNDVAQQQIMLASAKAFLGGFDSVIIAYGSLPDQTACEASAEQTQTEFNTNALSIITLLTLLANEMLIQRSGTIAVISSVAGDRGRKSNYVYGAAKAAISTFTQGLRARLHTAGIHVLTIKPGFVDTPMTAQLKKNFLFATPDKVANDIVRAIAGKKNILYTPWFWRIIMFLIKALPESIAKKLNF